MGWLSVIICAVPIYLLYNTGQPILWVLVLLNVFVNFWSYGIMHNHAVRSSSDKIKRLQENLALEGRLDAEKQREIDRIPLTMDLQAVPNWLTNLNMVTTLIGLVFLGYGVWLLL